MVSRSGTKIWMHFVLQVHFGCDRTIDRVQWH
jgi:hypothetical protein